MNKYLDVLNKLQDTFTQCGVSIRKIDLPQIAVVGCQSAGKSSVLESIAKQDLLPRGTGIVTRRPLVLQMINESQPFTENSSSFHTWAFFLHCKNKRFLNMKDVQQEIINNTNYVCGFNKGISDQPIHLKLHSTKVPSLTLIDLPGLTKIPVGDQPRDIDLQIEKLVRSYVNNEQTIILAISPGNVDIANSDSLRLARKVDPKGLRTLGVITKVDLMEDSAESIKLLQGKCINMRLGLVGVINRNNELLQKGISVEKALEYESLYLKKKFPNMESIMGVQYLSKRLCELLMKKLKCALPGLAGEIDKQLIEHRNHLEEFGSEVTDARMEIVNLIVKFNNNLTNSFLGKATQEHEEEYTCLMKGKKIDCTRKRFSSGGSKLLEVLESNLKVLDQISIEGDSFEVNEQVRACTGYQPSLFVPDSVFSVMISGNVHLLYQPVENVIDAAKNCINERIVECSEQTFKRFPKLELEVITHAKEVLQKQIPRIKDFMVQFLEIQQGFINTKNPQFDDRYNIASILFTKKEENNTSASMPPLGQPTQFMAMQNTSETQPSLDKEEVKEKEKELMIKLLERYFDIIKDMLKDTLLKAIIRILIVDFTSECSTSILSKILDDDLKELLNETPGIGEKRSHSLKMVETLTKAKSLLANIGLY